MQKKGKKRKRKEEETLNFPLPLAAAAVDERRGVSSLRVGPYAFPIHRSESKPRRPVARQIDNLRLQPRRLAICRLFFAVRLRLVSASISVAKPSIVGSRHQSPFICRDLPTKKPRNPSHARLQPFRASSRLRASIAAWSQVASCRRMRILTSCTRGSRVVPPAEHTHESCASARAEISSPNRAAKPIFGSFPTYFW